MGKKSLFKTANVYRYCLLTSGETLGDESDWKKRTSKKREKFKKKKVRVGSELSVASEEVKEKG